MSTTSVSETPAGGSGLVVPAQRALRGGTSALSGAWTGARRALDSGSTKLAERVEPARSRLAPMLGVVSPLGWGALAMVVACSYLGLTRGWLELVVIAMVFAVAFFVALLWVLRRSGYAGSIELSTSRVRPGDQAFGRVLVSGRDGKAAASTTAELPVGAGAAAFHIPRVATGDTHEELFAVPTRRRGMIPIGPARVVRADPFGLLRRQTDISERVELYIHPFTVPLSSGRAGFLRDIEGVTTQDLSSSDVSFHALRDYVPGDDRRAIHWRTTARVGRLMVRQFEETRRSHLLVVLAARAEDYSAADDFETAVSVAASMAAQALRDDREVTVVTHSGVIRSPTSTTMLDQMSGVDWVKDRRDLATLTADALRAVPGASLAALVTGGLAGAETLRSAETKVPLDIFAFAVRCAAQSVPARRRVGDLVVLDVTEVQGLPPAIASLR